MAENYLKTLNLKTPPYNPPSYKEFSRPSFGGVVSRKLKTTFVKTSENQFSEWMGGAGPTRRVGACSTAAHMTNTQSHERR
jgi:hypothetical protein